MSGTLREAGLSEIITVGNAKFRTENLLAASAIQDRVGEMGHDLAHHYVEQKRDEVHVLTVLSGGLHFASDLRRRMQDSIDDDNLDLDITSDEVSIESYAGLKSSGTLRFKGRELPDVADKHVLVVDDILDSGLTLSWLARVIKGQKPASLEVAVALCKNGPMRDPDILDGVAIHPGFDIGDEFVVGYGLDLDGHYRDLGGVYGLSPITDSELE